MSHTNLRDLVRPDPRERRVQLDDGIPPCAGLCGYSRFDIAERFYLVEPQGAFVVADALLRAVRARAWAWQDVLLCLPALWGGDAPR